MTTTTDKIFGEISVDIMENIIKTIPQQAAINNPDNAILIHGMGGQPRSFYRDLYYNTDVEILWTGWSTTVWWTYLLSFIPGQASLVKVINRNKLDSLYLDIGAQSMCGLYFVPNNKVDAILTDVKKTRGKNIKDILENASNYFVLTIDFDFHGGDRDGEIYFRELITGDNIDADLKQSLTNET